MWVQETLAISVGLSHRPNSRILREVPDNTGIIDHPSTGYTAFVTKLGLIGWAGSIGHRLGTPPGGRVLFCASLVKIMHCIEVVIIQEVY